MMRDHNLERASFCEERAVAKAGAFINEEWIFPGLKKWATAWCMNDPEGFREFVRFTKGYGAPPRAHLKTELMSGPPPSERPPEEPYGTMAAIRARPGLTEGRISKA